MTRQASGFPVLKITATSAVSWAVIINGAPLAAVRSIDLHMDTVGFTTATIVMDVAADVDLPAEVTIVNPEVGDLRGSLGRVLPRPGQSGRS